MKEESEKAFINLINRSTTYITKLQNRCTQELLKAIYFSQNFGLILISVNRSILIHKYMNVTKPLLEGS